MEYDNDRIRRHVPRKEIFSWVLMALLYPVANGISAFSGDASGWFFLLLISGFLFPVYLNYSRIMGTIFLVQKRKLFSFMMSLLSFLVVQVIIFTLYSLLRKFDLRPVEQTYFSLSAHTFIREALVDGRQHDPGRGACFISAGANAVKGACWRRRKKKPIFSGCVISGRSSTRISSSIR